MKLIPIAAAKSTPFMKQCLSRLVATVVCIVGLCLKTTAVAGQYEATFDAFADGATNLSPAGELFSNQLGTATKVVDASKKELQLTANGTGSTFSAFRLPDLDPGNAVCAFSAKWNAAIVGESPLADGLSFSFGPLGNAGSFFTKTTNPNEIGFGIGLAVGLITYGGNTPGYYVRVNGAVVPGGFVAKPDTDWGELNPTPHFFEVDWHYFNGLTLRVDGVAIFTNLPTPGFVPDIGHRFVFGARTGGFDQQVTLDNILVLTGGVLTPVAAAAPYYFNAENLPLEGAAQAFDGNVGTKWLAASSTGHIGASLSSAKTIRAYALSSANDNPIRDPKSWNFETGDNGTTWTNRGSKALQLFANRFEKRAFLVTSPAANSKFRLNITANNGSTLTQLAELQAWELMPGPAFFKVFSLADSSSDSLRNALTVAASASSQAVITFSSGLAGGTISPASVISINDAYGVAVDASNLIGGIVLNGGNARRIMNNMGTGQVVLNQLKFTGGNGVDTSTSGNAGALFAENGSTTVISRCTFSNNIISNGNGGAIVNGGTMTITDSLFETNTARFQGGAIQNEANLTMINCTITGNTAGSYGGGIQSRDTLRLRHCTISGNAGSVSATAWGGALDAFDATVTVDNCIISGNTSRGDPQDISVENATLILVGANIVGQREIFANVSETGPAPLTDDPLLAPIGDYGGPTWALALKRNSPARDASLNSTSSTDQRGFPRIGAPDLGAYETGNALLTNYAAWIWENLPAVATAGQHALDVDFDGDGQTNATEWFFFTDPGSSSSFFPSAQSEITQSNGQLLISFPTLTGRTYALWQNNTLTGPWQNTGLPAISGNDAVQQFTVPAPDIGEPKRFYRVQLAP